MTTNAIDTIDGYDLVALTADIAEKYKHEFTDLLNLIPGAAYQPNDLLADQKEERIYHAKWRHSLAIFDAGIPIAVLIAYERDSEGNEQYPFPNIYIHQLSVHSKYQRQGLGKKLVERFLGRSRNLGFTEIEGEVNFSIQTNSADSNRHVQKFYESLGFKKRATKEYPDRMDIVYGLDI